MIKITKNEAEYLEKCGRECDIHIHNKTHKGKKKRYFLTESDKSINLLNKYRKSIKATD